MWSSCLLGVVLALYVFMTDAIRATTQGADAVRNVLPVWFNWPLFLIAFALLNAPLVYELRRWRQQRRAPAAAVMIT